MSSLLLHKDPTLSPTPFRQEFLSQRSNLHPMTTLNVAEFSSLQAALDHLPATGGALYLPTGQYSLDEPA